MYIVTSKHIESYSITNDEVKKEETVDLNIESGHQIGKPEILFAKIHDRKDSSRLDIINKQKAKLEAVMAAEKADERPPIKDEIQFDG